MAELKHLRTAWDVDRRIVLDSADKLVIVRFSNYENPPKNALISSLEQLDAIEKPLLKRVRRERKGGGNSDNNDAQASSEDVDGRIEGMAHYMSTQQMDALLIELAPKVRKYCVIYAVDTQEVPEFNNMYELGHSREPFAVMFFFKNTHIKVDVGTGNNNKINFFAFEGIDDLVPIVDAAYRAGKLGKNMASSDTKFSTAAVQR